MDIERGISQYGSHTFEMKQKGVEIKPNLSHVIVDSFREFQSEIMQIGWNFAYEQFNKKCEENGVFLSGIKSLKIKDDEYISKRNMLLSIMSLLYNRLFLAQNVEYMGDNDKSIYSIISKRLIEDVNDNLVFYNGFTYSGIDSELSENIHAIEMKLQEKITELIKIIIFINISISVEFMLNNGNLLTTADSIKYKQRLFKVIIAETMFFRFATNAVTEQEKNISENKLSCECQIIITRALLDIDIVIKRFISQFNA
jgi:hypothetical protein